jgi:solute carrier family 7 (cationic amino acid transporter), member 1
MFFWLQVSVGTLLAFTVVAVSILILRYVPPDEVPLPPSLQESFRLNQECDEERDRALLGVGNCTLSQTKDVIVVVESVKDPLIDIPLHKGNTNLLSGFFFNFVVPTTDTFYFI